MARGRKPKLRVVGESDSGIGHNSELTDDQRQALTRQHKKKYIDLLDAKKKADADLRNLAKVIKADLGDNGLLMVKLLIQLDTDDGEANFRAEMEAKAMAARWAGMPIGAQGNLFDEDRRPVGERAFEEGKAAGLEGKDPKPPYAPGEAHEEWMRGWHDGQSVLASGFGAGPKADLLRPEGNEPPAKSDEFDAAE